MDQMGDTWRRWLTDALPPWIPRDPAPVAALLVSGVPADSPGVATIRDRTLLVPGTGVWDLTQYTLGSLATAWTAQGWTVTVAPGVPAALAAAALVDTGWGVESPTPGQDLRTYPTLGIAGRVVWQVLQPVAQAWDRLTAQLQNFWLGAWEGPWLDDLGTYLGVLRIGGEPDSLYQTRLFGLVFTGGPNAIAMEQLLAALGYVAVVTTTGPGTFTVRVQWPTNPPAGFVYTEAELAALFPPLQLAGTVATIIFATQLSDTMSLADTLTTASTPLAVWGNGTTVTGFPYNRATWQ